jgi:glucose/arabinose dehydrogenase
MTVHLEFGGNTYALEIPFGFRLKLLTKALQSPRLLTFAPDGDLFIGSKSGRVYRLRPPYRKAEVPANLGGYPHSVGFRTGVAIGPDGALYFTSDSGANALFRLRRSKSRPGG